jgi:hypothetical protein
MDMKKPAADATRAGVTNFSMMPLCQCFARRVNLYFDFFELNAAPRSTKAPSPASSRTNDRDEKARGQCPGAG